MSDNTSMVERIARAIREAEAAWYEEHSADMPCEFKALAALRVMREPTEAMVAAIVPHQRTHFIQQYMWALDTAISEAEREVE